jgi:hypothetical protein
MRDSLVSVSKLWTLECKRYMRRFMVLQMMFLDVMKELPPERAAYWVAELRGIDTRRKLVYDGPQATQMPQPTTSVSGDQTSGRPQGHLKIKEKPMRGDEEE